MFITSPITIFNILNSKKIHNSYNMNIFKKFQLGFRMMLNNIRIESGSAYNVHLAMALKILETPPNIFGHVVECGTWKGVSAVNLSLVCKITKRKLIIFDSFEGLPKSKVDGFDDIVGKHIGTLDEVKDNIRKYGDIQSCEFVKGWFDKTMPNYNEPILLAFLDVDLPDSLDVCVKNIWSNLTDTGFIFIDESQNLDYCALFFSEKWWKKNFHRHPPGLIGAGLGLALGFYYIGPYDEIHLHSTQKPFAGAYVQKNMSGFWNYYPEEN